MTLFKLIHLLAVLIWVGGMFFAHMVLRPAAAETLDVPQRLKLLDAVFRRFFYWVWGASDSRAYWREDAAKQPPAPAKACGTNWISLL